MRLSRSSRRGLEEAGIGENGVEELTPAKQATADIGSANPLRKAALIVVAVTILLFALSIVMERFTPSSSQAVVQAYILRTAPDVAGRVVGPVPNSDTGGEFAAVPSGMWLEKG
jgi:hypothetical protein